MGLRDWLNRGKKMAAENKDSVKGGIDKAGDFVDDKTGGKYADHVDQGQDKAKDYVDDLPEE